MAKTKVIIDIISIKVSFDKFNKNYIFIWDGTRKNHQGWQKYNI
jgi:hypothetical protein